MEKELLEYRFGQCRLNTATRELWLESQLQSVAPRVLELLICLLENRHRVVGKDELIDRVWKGAVLSEGALAQSIRKARLATGDSDDDRAMIKTLHRVGYRFAGEVRVATVKEIRNSATSEPRRSSPLYVSPSMAKSPTVYEKGTDGPITTARQIISAKVTNPAITGGLAKIRAEDAEAIPLFALDADVELRESVLAVLYDSADRLEVLVRLAWQLRQRDGSRAVSLADEADALLGSYSTPMTSRARARLMLVRGEVKWLTGELDSAADLAKQALVQVWGAGEESLRSDANLLLAGIASDQGRRSEMIDRLNDACSSAELAGDDVRLAVAKLTMACSDVLRVPAEAVTKWAASVKSWRFTEDAGVVALCDKFDMLVCATLSGDSAQALTHGFRAIDAARMTGQVREVIYQMCNVASRLCLLGDVEAGFEWQEPALQMATSAGWPLLRAVALQQGALLMKSVGRFAEADELLTEALQLLRSFPNSHPLTGTLFYQGFLRLEQGQYVPALESFDRLIEVATNQASQYALCRAVEGRARSLAALGRIEEALQVEEAALKLAATEGNAALLPYVLEGMAEIHRHPLGTSTKDMVAASAVLHFLERAAELHESVRKQPVPPSLLESIAAEYERLGQYQRAYKTIQLALLAQQKLRSVEATNRAIAMKVRYDTDRARSESRHLRALADAHADRSEGLARTNAILDRLSMIGQEITKQQTLEEVFAALERHVHGLMDASSLAVFVLSETGESLDLVFGMELGNQLAGTSTSTRDLEKNIVRCLRDRKEIYVAFQEGHRRQMEGTLATLSAIYSPLVVGLRCLGVITVQSLRPDAYGERERLVFRTISAYGAIALEHAFLYKKLSHTASEYATPRSVRDDFETES